MRPATDTVTSSMTVPGGSSLNASTNAGSRMDTSNLWGYGVTPASVHVFSAAWRFSKYLHLGGAKEIKGRVSNVDKIQKCDIFPTTAVFCTMFPTIPTHLDGSTSSSATAALAFLAGAAAAAAALAASFSAFSFSFCAAFCRRLNSLHR